MPSPYEHLIAAITETGVSEEEARLAAHRCAFAMAKQGAVGFAAGAAFAYFMAPVLGTNPVTFLPFTGTAATLTTGGALLGASHAALKSPQCGEVRNAIRYWTFASF